jgi:hypothetical protein
MKNKILLAVLAIALVSGMTACKQDDDKETTDELGRIKDGVTIQIGGGSYTNPNSLDINGIWRSKITQGGGSYYDIVKINNGNIEWGEYFLDGGWYCPLLKGTYTISSLIGVVTHYHGAAANEYSGKKVVDAKWYTKSEVLAMTIEGIQVTSSVLYAVYGPSYNGGTASISLSNGEFKFGSETYVKY